MAIGTRRKGLESERITIYLPSHLAIRIEAFPGLYDRFHQTTIFGARSQLFTQLLTEWLNGDPSEEDLLEVMVPRRRPGPKAKWLLLVPSDLHARVAALPGFSRSFGAYPRLASLLFSRWLKAQEQKLFNPQQKEPAA